MTLILMVQLRSRHKKRVKAFASGNRNNLSTPKTYYNMAATQAMLIGAAITALVLHPITIIFVSSNLHHKSIAPTKTPLSIEPLHTELPWNLGAATQVLLTHDEPTDALRAAVWAATAVTAAASVAVAAAPDQALRYRRPAQAGPRRWEAGWAAGGQAGFSGLPGHRPAGAAQLRSSKQVAGG
jgi:hypothetical protein